MLEFLVNTAVNLSISSIFKVTWHAYQVKIEPGTEQPTVPIGPVLPAEKSIVDIKQEPVPAAKQESGSEKSNNVPVSLVRHDSHPSVSILIEI